MARRAKSILAVSVMASFLIMGEVQAMDVSDDAGFSHASQAVDVSIDIPYKV